MNLRIVSLIKNDSWNWWNSYLLLHGFVFIFFLLCAFLSFVRHCPLALRYHSSCLVCLMMIERSWDEAFWIINDREKKAEEHQKGQKKNWWQKVQNKHNQFLINPTQINFRSFINWAVWDGSWSGKNKKRKEFMNSHRPNENSLVEIWEKRRKFQKLFEFLKVLENNFKAFRNFFLLELCL